MKIDFSDYALGAGAATDLVNTAPAVRSSGEILAAPAALAQFLAEHDLHPDAVKHGHRPTEEDLDQVRTLRQEVRTILEAATEEDVVNAANALVARAAIGPSLYHDATGRWQWCIATSSNASLADELAVLMGTGLLGALRTLSHDRFRHCTAPACNGMFVDTSKAGRRRYCMPGICGNRRNVANYRARKLTDTEGAPEGT
ncbi:CGNR zinc finger domain-containing protein [Streptomyces sp. Je 1-4]|uniref:CGNR zinc finger domain-containing protein n=1 Tax=Streptomyces TaxID=1883 RepID=UPI0021D9B90A|nr:MULTISPECIES: CGNR zinc finger domain-containing protein [unclassified Streptomyces]UYB38168.1 CGNR zinc finger domain-containing protein [Streptomyces sp. Je 1-4]UZQ34107.1 CGNR zinc finger domain-containing protein [Streptomyces sp. Je 1-4] [Streptomyces sp. Je 1-4 4N24]UZQ41525.1 CGNR zinc finger domain-containing protein [Streptomyces sp. Je 1-4] [Streptomyces sp. Je 1-4 4N24_ara]